MPLSARHLHLEGAYLGWARLEGADLSGVHLEDAYLGSASLAQANLSFAHLQGTYLGLARLEGADLRRARLDSRTDLSEATLNGKTRLGDIQWGGVGAIDLTTIKWERVAILGDERGVSLRSPTSKQEEVVRAYRQMATQLRAQGMNEVADRFLYRSQKRQRRALLRQGNVGAYLFSALLALLAGYGYRLGRIIVAYVLVVLVFAGGYLLSGGLPGSADLSLQQQALDAVQVSLNADPWARLLYPVGS